MPDGAQVLATVAAPYEIPTAAAEVSGRTVACQAANCWPLAKLLEQRARTLSLDANQRGHKDERAVCLQVDFLKRQAAWQRDVAAALALRAYYSWIANEQQLQLVNEGLQLQSELARTQQALIEKGVAISDPTALDRQRLELEDQRVQLIATQRSLAAALQRGTCCGTDLRSVAVEALEIQPQLTNCDDLIRFALQHRQDYLALVQLSQGLDAESARQVAQLLTPLVGVGLDMLNLGLIEKLCLSRHGDELLQQVRRELNLASQVSRTRIEDAVCEKCQALSVAYERVTIAEQVIKSWETRVTALKRLEELGDARGEAMATARSEWLTARAMLVTRKLSAKLAEVDLSEAVGDLAGRCCRGEAWLVQQ